MKYIKTYENNEELNDYKKFNIISVGGNLQIIEIIKKWEKSEKYKYEINPIYQLNKNNKIIKLNMVHINPLNFSIDFINRKILYSTNDLEDCLKQLPITADSLKYNL